MGHGSVRLLGRHLHRLLRRPRRRLRAKSPPRLQQARALIRFPHHLRNRPDVSYTRITTTAKDLPRDTMEQQPPVQLNQVSHLRPSPPIVYGVSAVFNLRPTADTQTSATGIVSTLRPRPRRLLPRKSRESVSFTVSADFSNKPCMQPKLMYSRPHPRRLLGRAARMRSGPFRRLQHGLARRIGLHCSRHFWSRHYDPSNLELAPKDGASQHGWV